MLVLKAKKFVKLHRIECILVKYRLIIQAILVNATAILVNFLHFI